MGYDREKCVSRGYIEDFDSLVDINNLGWDCGDLYGSGDRNPSVSCGCWNENKLSGGEISGIVIGVVVFLAIVATILSIYFRRICRYKSKNIITSLPDHEVVVTPEVSTPEVYI